MYIAIDAGSSFLKLGRLDVAGGNVTVAASERHAVRRTAVGQSYKYEYDIAGIVGQVRDYIDRAATEGDVEGILITAEGPPHRQAVGLCFMAGREMPCHARRRIVS